MSLGYPYFVVIAEFEVYICLLWVLCGSVIVFLEVLAEVKIWVLVEPLSSVELC